MLIAIPIVMTGNVAVLALPDAWHFNQWLGLGIFSWIAWRLYRNATATPRAP